MKRTETYAAPDLSMNAPATGSQVMEGAPSGLPKVRATLTTSVDSRPHILARRTARWARRANH
ncbi:MAG: hypothetical protein GYB42_05275 [Alphaproteobacteria bacterium]|nr:hypothetical protein [Alphaproteobacteria bacterium]